MSDEVSRAIKEFTLGVSTGNLEWENRKKYLLHCLFSNIPQISELEKKIKEHRLASIQNGQNIKQNKREISELKERFENHDQEKFRDLCHPTKAEYLNLIERSLMNKEVLHDHIKWHNSESYSCKKDYEELDAQLQKLEGEKE